MLNFIFATIIMIHGLIHLMGVAQEWKLTKIEQLSGKTLFVIAGKTAKLMGFLWLLTFVLFLIATIGVLWKLTWWWMFGGLGVLLSQILIIVYWADAKVGTIANVLILLPAIVAYGGSNFDRLTQREVDAILQENHARENEEVTTVLPPDLPTCIRQWLISSNALGSPKITHLHLTQRGEMRTKPAGPWMEVSAKQYFSVDPPAFVWEAKVKVASLLNLAGLDTYRNGKGHMLIKLMSLFPIVDASGPQTDQGTLVRFLSEIVWFPTAALSQYITWEEIDAHTAQATMHYGDITASGVFTFNEQGDMTDFEAQRYYEQDGSFSLQTWHITSTEYKSFQGVRIPVKSEVTWKLADGDFTWFKVEVTDVVYNN